VPSSGEMVYAAALSNLTCSPAAGLQGSHHYVCVCMYF